jgi:alpha-beta hydrolase superfamily lysophospholipase
MDDAIWDGTAFTVAHSLGTVIAIDAVLNSESFAPSDRITLITMGSPLLRFFPGSSRISSFRLRRELR